MTGTEGRKTPSRTDRSTTGAALAESPFSLAKQPAPGENFYERDKPGESAAGETGRCWDHVSSYATLALPWSQLPQTLPFCGAALRLAVLPDIHWMDPQTAARFSLSLTPWVGARPLGPRPILLPQLQCRPIHSHLILACSFAPSWAGGGCVSAYRLRHISINPQALWGSRVLSSASHHSCRSLTRSLGVAA